MTFTRANHRENGLQLQVGWGALVVPTLELKEMQECEAAALNAQPAR